MLTNFVYLFDTRSSGSLQAVVSDHPPLLNSG